MDGRVLTTAEIRGYRFLAGFPPFSGATAEETWSNLKNWQKVLRRPHYDRAEDRIFNLNDEAWSAITWYVRYLIQRIKRLLIPLFSNRSRLHCIDGMGRY